MDFLDVATQHLHRYYGDPTTNVHIPVAQNHAWVCRFQVGEGIISPERIAAIQCAQLSAYTNPNTAPEIVELVADLLVFLFVFDDVLGEYRGARSFQEVEYGSFLTVLHEDRLPSDPRPLHKALLDIRRRVGAWYQRMDRFHDSFANYFEGCVTEAVFRRQGAAPSIAEYLELREKCIGLYPVLTLLEAKGCVPDAEFKSPEFQRLRTLSTLIISLVNDIYSLRKEQAQGEFSNFVLVAQVAERLSLDEAIRRTLTLHDTMHREFNDLETTIVRGFGPATRSYCQGLRHWLRGNYYWSLKTQRYQEMATVRPSA